MICPSFQLSYPVITPRRQSKSAFCRNMDQSLTDLEILKLMMDSQMIL